jgi:hypothetical protein
MVDCCLIPGRTGFFSSPQHPDWLWGPPILPSSVYWVLFWGVKQSGCEAKTHLNLVLRLRMHGAIPLVPHTCAWCCA